MPLNPPPTIGSGLCLINQGLIRSDMSRAAEVTFAVLASSTPSVANAQTAVNSFQTVFNSVLGPGFDSEVTILKPTIKMGDGSTTPFEAVATGATIVGGTDGVFSPPNVALLVKKTTGVGGRKNRGRTYFPFFLPNADVLENGTVGAAALASLNSALFSFLGDLATDNIPMVIANRTFNTPVRPHYVTAISAGPHVTNFVGEPLVGTQRRRLGR